MRKRILKFEELSWNEVTALVAAMTKIQQSFRIGLHGPRRLECLVATMGGSEVHLATISPGLCVINRMEYVPGSFRGTWKIEIVIEPEPCQMTNPDTDVNERSPLAILNLTQVASNLIAEALGERELQPGDATPRITAL